MNAGQQNNGGGLLGELSRRNVIRVAAAYAVAGWLLTEVASVVLPVFGAPEWVLKVLILLLMMGFPLVLVFSWVYELTPEGVKREKDVNRDRSITPYTGRRLDLTTMALVVVGIAFVIVERTVWSPSQPPVAATTPAPKAGSDPGPQPAPEPATEQFQSDARQSVAVLPFVNMSDDPANEYFSDGISEELLNVLVKVQSLRVPSRTSSFAFKGQTLPIADIARQLKVDHVLEGSVRKAGEQVRVTAQLIDARSDAHLWSDTYTRTLDDIFAIQDEIAHAIVDALKLTLDTGEALVVEATDSTDAYNHFLKGRYYWHQRNRRSFELAEEELRRAVELDPGYSESWAALADIYVLQPEYRFAPIEVAIPKAKAAIERALAIDATSARALTARAYLHFLYDWNYAAAEADFREAIAIDPGYATAHQWYAEFLFTMRRFDKALAMAQRAMDLDPLAPVIPMIVANMNADLGEYETAIEYYQRSLDLAPNWFNALGNMTGVLVYMGRYDEALDSLERIQNVLDLEPEVQAYNVAAIRAMAGEIPVADAVNAVLESPYAWCSSVDGPWWLATLGAHEEAMDMIEGCPQQGDPYAPYINHMRPFEPMRGLPRFQALLARVNLPVENGE